MSAQTVTKHHSTAWLQPFFSAMQDTPVLAIDQYGHYLTGNLFALDMLGTLVTPSAEGVFSQATSDILMAAILSGKSQLDLHLGHGQTAVACTARLLYPNHHSQAYGLLLQPQPAVMTDPQPASRMHGLSPASTLDTLITCDWMLHAAADWQQVVEPILQQACGAFHFQRGQVIQHQVQPHARPAQVESQLLHQWSLDDAQPGASINMAEIFLRWHQVLANGEPVSLEIASTPQTDSRHLLIVPLMVHQAWWGSLLFERMAQQPAISSQEMGALMAIGRTMSVAIDREQTDKRLNLAKIAFDSTSEGIMITNPAGEIVGINQGFSLITGYQETEVLGTKPQVFRQRPRGFFGALKRDSKWTGEIENFRQNGEAYTEWITISAVRNAQNQIVNYVGVFADISEIKRSQYQLNALVNHDPLTGLPNRRLVHQLFDHALQRAQRNRQQAAVLFIDLDRFKNINDSLGHYAGDQLLMGVTERIRGCLRACDIVGRLGGDEFIVMLENQQHRADAARKAQDILTALKREFLIEQHELYVGASIGIAMYPDDGKDVESLIKAADLAMYQVKNNGKNHHAFYNPALSREVVEHFQMENELRQAMAKQQLRVYYQAQIDLNTGMIVGAEALLRWQHPTQGLIPPNKFIPLAEETGLILSIGEWILTQAANQAKEWQRHYPEFRKIAVNVSGVQILKSQFADTVYGTLIETDCDPSLIALEITESTLMQHTQHVVNTFDQLKQLGVSIAIDDFGTGYSSLAHLKRLPLDQIKIDRSFVKDLPLDKDDAAITSAIYAMATQLGFAVVAEGVETEAQEQFLQHLGCQTAQGFLYAYPVSTEAFQQLLALNNQTKIRQHHA